MPPFVTFISTATHKAYTALLAQRSCLTGRSTVPAERHQRPRAVQMESEDREILSKRSRGRWRRMTQRRRGRGDRSQDHEGREDLPGSTRGLRRPARNGHRPAEPDPARLQCGRRPMGTGISIIINGNSGSGLDGPPGPGRRRRSLVQSRATATTSSPIATQHAALLRPTTGQELLGIVDFKGTPAGPDGCYRDTESTVNGDRRDPRTDTLGRSSRSEREPRGPGLSCRSRQLAAATPQFRPDALRSSAPTKVGTPTDATGCIAVFSTEK